MLPFVTLSSVDIPSLHSTFLTCCFLLSLLCVLGNGKAEAEQKPQKAEQPAAKVRTNDRSSCHVRRLLSLASRRLRLNFFCRFQSAPTPATPAAAAGAAAEPAKKGEDEFDLWAEDDEDAEKQREIMKKVRACLALLSSLAMGVIAALCSGFFLFLVSLA